jgi:hypothetical protein
MGHFIPRRPAVVGLLVALAACSDSAPISAPEDAGTALGRSAEAPGDTALTTSPVTPATPAPTINLGVTVGAAVAGRDSLQYTPLADAKVTVYEQTLVASPGGGGDTLTVSERAVANAATDANGKVIFNALPAAQYRVEAVRSGNGGGSASINLAPPYVADVGVVLIIRP